MPTQRLCIATTMAMFSVPACRVPRLAFVAHTVGVEVRQAYSVQTLLNDTNSFDFSIVFY
jgi:hypothetical protein